MLELGNDICSFFQSLYLGFVRNCKFVTSKTKPLVQFMQNSLVEMYALDENLTYQQAFVYIRQLAIQLRNAITNKKKVSVGIFCESLYPNI